MTYLFLIMALITTPDCRVHREQPKSPCAMWGNTCQVISHYLPCTVVEKCDTVFYSSMKWQDSNLVWHYVDSFSQVICYPDTLVDSGAADSIRYIDSIRAERNRLHPPLSGQTIPEHPAYRRWIESIYNPPDSVSIPKPILDSADLADLREMLREWRVEKCYRDNECWPFLSENSTITAEMWRKRNERNKAIRDSCECVYGKQKGQSK